MIWKDGVACNDHGTWKIRYRVPLGPDTRATKQITETLRGCRNRLQARQVLALRMAAVFDGSYRPRTTERPPTVADFAPLFLEAKRDLSSAKKYKSQLDKHLLRVFGRKLLRDVTVMECDAYRRARIDAGAAPATARNELRCLQSLFVEARSRGLVTNDPVSGVAFGKIDNTRRRLMGEDERGRLLAELSKRDDFLRPLFVLLYYTGMRLGDACALPWSRIDFGENVVALRQSKTDDWVYVPMHPTLRAELERWKEACGSDEWVMPSPQYEGRHMSKFVVALPWKELLAAAKVENLWRHDLRRHLVTMLRAAGVGDGVIASISGHKTVQMIERYDNPQIIQARAAVLKLPDLTGISEGRDSSREPASENETKPR